VDPGLGTTGYAVVERDRDGYRVLEAGVLRKTDARERLAERLVSLAEELDAVLAEYEPDAVAVEQLYAHYKHPRTAILMGHARGVLLLCAARRGRPVLDLPSTLVKRRLTGSGHASKQQIQKVVTHTLGLRTVPRPPDVADALAIAICALHHTSQPGASLRRARFAERSHS
jgi:crossover junction endodeoxyribonuclease RuvC